MNLVVNAADALNRPGTITISTLNCFLEKSRVGYETIQAGEYAVMRIEDTGNGIAPDDLEKIFEPFYTKKLINKNGTGLGLAVVWGTVKDHNGFIDLRSVIGKGTIFSLYFPITREAIPVNPREIQIDDFLGYGEKILVIDDISEQRDIAAKILSRLGYFVITASSGTEGIDYLGQHPVNLVVIDMIMEPGLDGLETYMEILKLNPKQKAIIISGYSETDRVKKAQSLGAVEYVKKPYTIQTLGNAVKRGLAGKTGRQE